MFADIGSSAKGGRRLGGLLAFAPLLLLAGIGFAVVRGYHERATQAFEFPMVVELPGWGVWSMATDLLVLVKEHSTICLFRRPPATLPSVLAALDPDHALDVVEGAVESPTRIEVELPGELLLRGQIRMLGEGGYLLMLGPVEDAELIADIDKHYLPRTRPRAYGEKPQKFRPLAKVEIAMARTTT